MTEAEFRQWMAYYEIEPFGEERQDLRFANLCLLVARLWGDKKKTKGLKVSDFMLKFGPSAQQSIEQMKMFLLSRGGL
jgi:hypothetical protein